MEIALAACFGLLIGSFLNVCILRLPWDYSVMTPRSHCYGCGAILSWFENIPVLSWLALRGRCRRCRLRISWRYPAIELLTAVCFAFAVRNAGWSWSGFRLCAFCALMIGLIFTDVDWHILPDEFTLGGLVLGLALAAITPVPIGIISFIFPLAQPRLASFVEACLASAGLGGLLWSIGILYEKVRGREGLGFGDVKMIAMIGAFLGLIGALQVLMIGSISGAVLGSLWIFFRKGDFGRDPLPLGAFLGVAGLAVALH